MVTILRTGTPPREKEYRVTCRTCNTEFTFKRHEAEAHAGYDQRDGPYLSIKCPLAGCNSNVTVTP